MRFLIPQLLEGSGLRQRTDFHKYDVLEHSLQAFKFSNSKIRLSALLHDIGKPWVFLKTGKYSYHDKEGVRIADEILTKQIRVSNKVKKGILREIEAHMFDVKGLENTDNVRLFFVKYYENLENIFLLRQADYEGAGVYSGICPVLQKWRKIYSEMKEQNIPFKIAELNLKGADLAELNIEKTKISNLQKLVFNACVLGKVKKRKTDLLAYAEKIIKA
jgi:tRNA nucleotidyltransferase (CCA-adding enzyme)